MFSENSYSNMKRQLRIGRGIALCCCVAVLFTLGIQTPSAQLHNLSQENESRTILFAGYEWNVKSAMDRKVGPGPNYFSDTRDNVWVDSQGRLHLKVTRRNGKWFAAEVYMDESLGHGEYTYYVQGPIDQMDPNLVFAPFLYRNESQAINIEFAKWGNPLGPSGNYVVHQPDGSPSNTFGMDLNGQFTTHKFLWTQNRVYFQSMHGHHLTPPNKSNLITVWTHPNRNTEVNTIPKGELKPHINLWMHRGNPPINGSEFEMIIRDFDYRVYSE